MSYIIISIFVCKTQILDLRIFDVVRIFDTFSKGKTKVFFPNFYERMSFIEKIYFICLGSLFFRFLYFSESRDCFMQIVASFNYLISLAFKWNAQYNPGASTPILWTNEFNLLYWSSIHFKVWFLIWIFTVWIYI